MKQLRGIIYRVVVVEEARRKKDEYLRGFGHRSIGWFRGVARLLVPMPS